MDVLFVPVPKQVTFGEESLLEEAIVGWYTYLRGGQDSCLKK